MVPSYLNSKKRMMITGIGIPSSHRRMPLPIVVSPLNLAWSVLAVAFNEEPLNRFLGDTRLSLGFSEAYATPTFWWG
jgi:hypothetical protein